MAMASRALTRPSVINQSADLVTTITSALQTLHPRNHKNPNFNPATLNEFSVYLNPSLVIQVIKNQSNPYHGLIFFNWATNPNKPNPNNYSHNFNCYIAIFDLLLSHSLFSTASWLLHNSNRLSDFMVGKFIKAYGDRGDIRSAIYWFHRAKEIENGRCLYSYNSILGVLVRGNRMMLAQAFYDQMLKEDKVKPDVSTYTTMIRGFCKVGLIEDAHKVFVKMSCEPNSLTYNTLINGYCKKGDMDNAMKFFNRMMEKKDCFPDTVTYTTLIDGYCKKGEFDEAVKCMNEMVNRGCDPNVLTYNALINGLCLKGDVDGAKIMMTKMRLNGLKDNAATHTCILKGLCISGRYSEAAKHLKEMPNLGISPDVKSYGVVINGYCKTRQPNEAISLLQEMKASGINPGVSSFNAVLRVLIDNKELDRATMLLKQMPQMGCLPNFISYNTVITSLCGIRGRMQQVEELVNDMLSYGCVIDTAMYGCLVKGFYEDGNDKMAMWVFYEAIDKGHVLSLESFAGLVVKFCEMGKVTEVETMFEEMCKKCNVLDLDSYKRVLDEQLCL